MSDIERKREHVVTSDSPLLSVIFILLCFWLLGDTYIATKLYFSGESREVEITSVHHSEIVIPTSGPVAPGTRLSYTTLTLKGYSKAFLAPYNYYEKGESIWLLYSNKLREGVITKKEEASFWEVLTGSHIDKFGSLLFSLVTLAVVTIIVLTRFFFFMRAVVVIPFSQLDMKMLKTSPLLKKISYLTVFATNVLTTLLIIIFVVILVLFTFAAVFYVESSHRIVIGVMICFVGVCLLFPAPENLAKSLYEIIRGPKHKGIFTIAKNVLSCCGIIWVMVKIVLVMCQEDFEGYTTLWDVLLVLQKSLTKGIL